MGSETRKTISTLGKRGRSKSQRSILWQYGVIFVGVVCCLGLLSSLLGHGSEHTTSHLEQLHSQIQIEQGKEQTTTTDKKPSQPSSTITTTVQSVREEFYHRYGGRESAEALLARGVQSFGSIQATAERMLRTAADEVPFVLSFAGYSVTVGRGNYYSQSFPFVLQRVIEPLLQDALSVDVQVINAAIGGIPSYPYAFCFEHFLGSDPNVISWDFSMNEGRGAAVLESYLRQSQHQLHNRPMVILLDTNKQRCQLLKRYTELGLLPDGMCVGMAKDVVQDKNMLELPDKEKPPGFQHWKEFGAPQQCPGRGSWHPKKMEHELIGWMMAMYFVPAVEEAQKIMSSQLDWKAKYRHVPSYTAVSFPKPLAKPLPKNSQGVTDLLFGHPTNKSGDEVYTMKKLSCRTNFLPATDQDRVLPSIIVSGLSPGVTADNIMEERSDEAYNSGWVLGVSKVERETKIKVEKCGGLGYVDLKTALYGIPESGTLRMWLPMEATASHGGHKHDNDKNASHWFDELVVCEANEKRPEEACHLDSDLEFTVGGVQVDSPQMIAGAAEYLKRKTCVHVGIPPEAKVTELGDVQSAGGDALSVDERRRFGSLPNDQVGLIVDVKAKGNVSRKDGACCLSHVVWEQH